MAFKLLTKEAEGRNVSIYTKNQKTDPQSNTPLIITKFSNDLKSMLMQC